MKNIILLLAMSLVSKVGFAKELIYFDVPAERSSGSIEGDVKSNRSCALGMKFVETDINHNDLVIKMEISGNDGFEPVTREVRIPSYKKDPKTGKEYNLFPLVEGKIEMHDKKKESAYYRNGLLFVRTSPAAGELLEFRLPVTERLIPTDSVNIHHFRYMILESWNSNIVNYNCTFDAAKIMHSIQNQ